MKLEITYYKGDKKVNDLLRAMDLDEGVFCQEKATATLKKGIRLTEAWKEKFIEAYTQVHKEEGIEVIGFEFKRIV